MTGPLRRHIFARGPAALALSTAISACGATEPLSALEEGARVCGERNAFADTQVEIDAMAGCAVWRGVLEIGADLDLSPLAELRVVERSISLGDDLVELGGFGALEEAGIVALRDGVRTLDFPRLRKVCAITWLRPQVVDLTAFSALEQLEVLDVAGGRLNSLRGLEAITEVDELLLSGMGELESLQGLEGLERINTRLTLLNHQLPREEVQELIERTGVPVWIVEP